MRDADESPAEPTGKSEPTEKSGTYVVTHAGDDDAVLAAVADGQVHALSGNPGLEAGEVLVATLAAEPPLEVTWSVRTVEDRWTVAVERVAESPSSRARDLAADATEGDLASAGTDDGGELHVLPTPEPEDAAADVVEDDATRHRAARLGASRVEVRTAESFVSIRYLAR